MNRTLLALLLTASVAAIAQAPAVKPTTPAPAAKPVQAAPGKPAPAAAPAKAAATSTAIVCNKDSKIFHRADCKSVGKMKESNKVPMGSAAEAQKAGYKPCKECKPLG